MTEDDTTSWYRCTCEPYDYRRKWWLLGEWTWKLKRNRNCFWHGDTPVYTPICTTNCRTTKCMKAKP